MAKVLTWRVPKKQTPIRLDQYLSERTELHSWSKRAIRRALDRGEVSINQKIFRHANQQITPGMSISIILKENASKIEGVKILYDQNNILAISKPAGVLSQPEENSGREGAVKLATKSARIKHLILCHRLDAETSGILLFAKNQARAEELFELFATKKIQKSYLAIVHGRPKQAKWTTKLHLTKFNPRAGRVLVSNNQKPNSNTRFEVLKHFKTSNLSLINCFPESGKTHQIRVHLEQEGLPILGDKIYSRKTPQNWPQQHLETVTERHLLHAEKVQFQIDSKKISIEDKVPARFQKIIDWLEKPTR